MKPVIHLSLAHMSGREQEYIKEAFDTNWITPLGPNVDAFEKELEESLLNTCCAVALNSGTAALHLALTLLGVKQGDEVICQSFTFAASANPIVYQGATPVFVDSETDTWNMDPVLLEDAIKDRLRKTGKLPKAIIPVHLYGMPAKMDLIMEIANCYDIPVLEDAAEALGSEFEGRMCGVFGRFGVFSFNGNKMITTSGGGALLCPTEEEASRACFYASQARENYPYYQHEQIGYNYRMSNISAGIGRGQLTVLNKYVARRRAIHALYTKLLKDLPGISVMQNPSPAFNSNFWLPCILVEEEQAGVCKDTIRLHLENENIESRHLWKPMHLQPVFSQAPFYGNGTSASLFEKGLCLPSGPALTDNDVIHIANAIRSLIIK